MRQQKAERKCPMCGGPLKRTIGSRTRAKYWECADKGQSCFRVGIKALSEALKSRDSTKS